MHPNFTHNIVGGIIHSEVCKLTKEELYQQLTSDLQQINLPLDEVDISFRPFSKTYYGRYFPVYNDKTHKPRIFIYPYDNEQGDFMNYKEIMKSTIHEFCHHIQYTDRCFVRNKGVMHDTQFWKLYNHYLERAIKYRMIEGD